MEKRKTLLVVNDDPKTLKLLSLLLEHAGFSMLVASNGFDALVMTRRNKPDLVVTDILMRGMDGLELCRQIRGDPSIAHIPVILTSNLSLTREDLSLAQSVRANAFVPTSHEVRLLLAKICELLS